MALLTGQGDKLSHMARLPDLVLDMDGTLMADQPALQQLVDQRLRRWLAVNLPSLNIADPALLRPDGRLASEKVMQRIVMTHGPETLRALTEYLYRPATAANPDGINIGDYVPPDPALAAWLRAYQQAGGRIFLFTSAPQARVRMMLRQIGIADLFTDETIFSFEDMATDPKPSAASHRGMLARFGLEPMQTVLVDDNPLVLQVAKQHSPYLRTVGVASDKHGPVQPAADVVAAGPGFRLLAVLVRFLRAGGHQSVPPAPAP